MGLMDRMMAKSFVGTSEDGLDPATSSTLALAEAPVITRIRTVLEYFTKSMSKANTSGQSSKVAFLMKKILLDALEEAGEVPPEFLEVYMKQAAGLVLWAATGDRTDGIPLPDDFPGVRGEYNLITPGENAPKELT